VRKVGFDRYSVGQEKPVIATYCNDDVIQGAKRTAWNSVGRV
jgi:hypothetical protein